MKVFYEGEGKLLTNPDPDTAREYFRKRSRAMTRKVMDVKEAVAKFVGDGDYLAIGGFGGVRIPTAALHEIVRQKKKHLGLAGHTSTHDFQILAAGECFDRVDIAYVVGLEARGISRNARRYLESGKVEMVEWTNASLTWRIKAAALGVPFLVGRQGLGADSVAKSAGKVIECPYTGRKLMTYPALYPDVAVIHAHEADEFGNCTFRGASVSDEDLARASKKVIVTCERLVPSETFRNDPNRTMIPYFCVDAVCETPYGSYPGNMPGEYFSDEEHLKEWLDVERDDEAFKKFLNDNIFGVKDFEEYLDKHGGVKKIEQLRQKELMIGGE
jgi:glutaconate CoA-transferase subunit A